MAINSRIHILKYNTYFDRIYKKEENIAAYDQYLLYDKTNNPGIFNVDFKPNDGVAANQIINWNGDEPNYVVVTDYVDTENIVSRWFVMECTRIRGGQYQLSLRRDVVADNIDAITASTAYINKAIVPDENPLIYNQEEITTNQIKSNEIQLKDDTGSAWIIGYVARNYNYNNGSTETGVKKNKMTLKGGSIISDITVDDLSSWQYNQYRTNYCYFHSRYDFDFQINFYGNQLMYRNCSPDSTLEKIYSGVVGYSVEKTLYFNNWISDKNTKIRSTLNEYESLYNPHIPNYTLGLQLLRLKGKIIRTGTSEDTYKYYKINIEERYDVTQNVNITENKSGDYVFTYLNNLFDTCPYKANTSTGHPYYRFSFQYNTLKIVLTEISSANYILEFPYSDISDRPEGDTSSAIREHLKDAPYDMFAIPYTDDITVKFSDSNITTILPNKNLSLEVAQLLATKISNGLYDLQLLPYCPFTGYNVADNTITIPYLNSRVTFVDNENGKAQTALIWCTASSGTKNIILDKPLIFTNKKIENQCSFYRLVSPNYNGQFEFNLAKNAINPLQSFNVDFTYIPYNPYIHVNPSFSGLYGEDWNDARGLICGGDFSVARTNSAWENYQLQNKNYLAIFDRQTQNLDFNHKYDFGAGVTQAVLGSFQGAASGMAMGSLGGGVGAAIGGIVGGVTSLAGGIADVGISEAKYGESMKYRKDIFNMNLENVQALPNSIAKSNAFTYNNKIFPILEFYTCTDAEKQVVANLIANSSMKVGSIDTVSTYIGNTWSYGDIHSRGFLSCQIIKLGNLSLDTHMQYAIFDEMEKGIYFGG